MELFLTITDIALAFYCAFTAGKFKAAIDIDREVLKKETPKSIYFWMWANAVVSVYLMISLFGRGIERGTM